MMIKPIEDLLKELNCLQIELWKEGDRLRYKAPKQSLSPELLQQLRDRKAEILAALSEDKVPLQDTSIATHPVEKTFPLSFAQQRLWFLDQLEPNRAIYNISSGYQLTGQLNHSALERSLQEIVRRHESLRTNFKEYDGSPFQIIAPHTQITLPVTSLAALPEESRQIEVQRLLQIEARKPFNLETDPLWRAQLLRLSDSEHILLLTLHHIITDGWSMGIFWRELSLLYNAFNAALPSPLPSLPIQYVDYAIWQRKYLQGEVFAAQLKYWTQQLGGELPILNLPTDYPRPPVLTYQGSRQSITLSHSLTTALKTLSQQQGVTLFMTLLAAFKTLLHRYSGQDNIIVGSPIAGRNRQEIELQIGFFVNTLVLRTDLTGNPSFLDLLAQVREVTLSAYEHQDLPFEKIVEELEIERDRSRSPLFQVMFALQNTRQNNFEIPGLIRSPVKVNIEFSKFDLTFNFRETSTGIQGTVGYSTDLFHEDTIARMLGHFQVLLEGIVTNPSQAIGDLPLLTATERDQILTQWNYTKADYPEDKCLHQLFEAQVERTPDAIALVFEEQTLTYRELNIKANQLAHYLQSLGAGPEVFVGICLERSLEAVIALLGILKAGGAYVFLDPTYPTDHLAWILQDTKISILVTNIQSSLFLPACTAQLIYLDQANLNLNAYPQENSISAVQPSHLMTIIYTSGSTGKPKGVMIEHRGVVNTIWFRVTQQFTQAELALFPVISSFAFDGSLGQLFPPLLVGGKALLLKQATDLFDLLDKTRGVTALGVPSLLSIMLQKRHLPDSVQSVLVGAEAVSPELVQTLSRYPHVLKIINIYGPTEASIFSTTSILFDRLHFTQKIGQDNAESTTQQKTTQLKVTIGKPISNVQVYLLDKFLKLVPIGVPGEIYIGGLGLARGYLNRPELTAEKFIVNPFIEDDRLYKTGDLGRYLPDGNIEFLGRIDHQVKIRGFRIELGEIEVALAQHSQVEEVVVIVREDQPGEKYLVAYIVPNQYQVPLPDDLRQFLKQRLPNYMIPSAFVPLEAIPLTLNGKIDRRALPVPDWQQQSSATFVAPRNLMEEQLAEIWRTILWREQPVGIHDNFFELGGHSLLAVRLVSEIEKTFNTKLPLATLFQLATIAELAEILSNGDYQTVKEHQDYTEKNSNQPVNDTSQVTPQLDLEIHRKLLTFTSAWKGQRVTPDSLIVGLNSGGTQPPLFWCFQGFRELSQMAKYIGADQPVYGMRSGHLLMSYTDENIQALAAYYVQEILRVQPTGSYRLGGNCQAGKIIFTVAQQLQQQGKPVALLCLLEAFIAKPYFSPVTFFFGQESDRFNPYKSFSEPELGYRKYYRGGFSITIVPGGHGQYFSEPNIQVFAREVRQALDKANVSEQAILTSSAYQAHISSVSSLTFVPGETYSLTVTVKNMSPVTWLATEQSGIFLANHWVDGKGNVIRWMDGRTAIDRNLAPNESIQLELTVTAPIELGQYQLELDLVEEGITWFKTKGSESIFIQVEVSELNEIQGEALQKIGYLQQDENLNQNISVSSSRVVNLSIVEDVQSRQRGDDRFIKGDFAGAIAHYEKAIQQNPAQPAELYLNLGKALSRMGRATEAISYCQTAIQLDPTFAQAYEQLGTIQRKQGDLEGAIASYQTVLQLDPSLTWIYPILGEIYAKREQLEAAIAAYQVAVERLEHKPDLYLHLGNLLMKQGDLDAAIAHFQQALSLNIEGSTIYIRLGIALSQKGQLDDAVTAYRQALMLSPNNAYVYTMLGHTQKKQEAFEDAIKSYQQAIQYTSQPHPGTYKNLGDCCRQLGKTAEAIAAYQQACVLQPDSAGLYRILGDVQFQGGAMEASIASYQKAIELEPQQPFAVYKRLGDLLCQTGAIEAAVLAYQAALQLQPHNQTVQQVLDKLAK